MTEPLTAHGRYVLTTSRLHVWAAFDANDILLIEQEAADAARKAPRGSGLDVERFQEAWRRAERAVNVGGHRLTPHDVAREYAALDPTP